MIDVPSVFSTRFLPVSEISPRPLFRGSFANDIFDFHLRANRTPPTTSTTAPTTSGVRTNSGCHGSHPSHRAWPATERWTYIPRPRRESPTTESRVGSSGACARRRGAFEVGTMRNCSDCRDKCLRVTDRVSGSHACGATSCCRGVLERGPRCVAVRKLCGCSAVAMRLRCGCVTLAMRLRTQRLKQ